MAESSLKAAPGASRPEPPARLRFSDFLLDLQRAELLRDGRSVALRPKVFALLALLARNPGRVMSKQEILDGVWPGLVVTDDSLTQAIHDLRFALGEAGPQLVRTVARRGYRFEAAVHDADGPTETRPARRLGAKLTLAALAAMLLLTGAFALFWPMRPGGGTPPLSIAVMPLASDGGAGADEWFADALLRDLTTELGRISGTFVISQDTARSYKGKAVDPRRVARELGVRYVVTGAVRRTADRVHLSLAMIDGTTGSQHWGERFDIERTALDEVLDTVARQVARSLSVQMHRSGGERAARLAPDQVQADDLAMQGWSVYFRGVSRDNLQEAGQLFEASVARDARSIRGWGGVAVVNGLLVGNLWAPDRSAAMARLEDARLRLHALDQDDVHAWYATYFVALLNGDYEGLLAISTEMTSRFPSNPQAHFGRGVALMNLGRLEECVEPTQRAIRLGPRDPALAVWNRQIGTCHFLRGEYREAAAYARKAQQLNPNLALPALLLAASLARADRLDEARAVVAEIRKRNPDARAADVERILRVNRNERYLEGRQRWIDTLRELGLP